MKKIIWSLALLIYAFGYAQTNVSDLKINVVSEHENTPLFGATVAIESLSKGAVSDEEGNALITNIPNGTYEVTVSYVGFETHTLTVTLPSEKVIQVALSEGGHELEEVYLKTTRSSRTIKKIPTRIEFIGGEELGEKNMMNSANISMVLRESTGIQMQQTSLSSGNTNIKIQGLDGRYTQLLRDGLPQYGGFSSGLSIMQIPPLDLKQFEIIKGSSSTLYGGGAIAGLVNLISKTPEEEPNFDIMLTQTHALGTTANIFFSKRKNKFGYTLYGSAHHQTEYDAEDDLFSNLPHAKSISFNPKFFFYPNEATEIWFGLNGTYDERTGGDMEAIKNGPSAEHSYTEKNTSKRMSSQFSFVKKISDHQSWEIKNTFGYFDRDLSIPDYNFQGNQFNSFTEINYQVQNPKTDWIFGGNLYTVDFDETNPDSFEKDQNDLTAGLFVNNILDISESWILESGLRTDFTNDWGMFALPKVSLLYKNDHGFSSRLGGGLGYKTPDIFTEDAETIYYQNIQPIDKDALSAETSYGGNFDVNYQTTLGSEVKLSFNQLFYVTAISNALLLNSAADNSFLFENAEGKVVSKGAETNIKFSFRDFKWFLNYAYIDATLNYLPGNPQKPLTPRNNAGSVIMYETETWRIGYETYYTGSQNLSNGTRTDDYVTMGLLLMRNFDWGGIYTNFENFTNVIQSDFSPLVLPPHENPTFPEIYAPSDGFIFSLGIIIKPFGNHGHH